LNKVLESGQLIAVKVANGSEEKQFSGVVRSFNRVRGLISLEMEGQVTEKNQPIIEEGSEAKPHSQTGIWEVEDENGKRSILYNVGSDDNAQGRKEIEQEKLDRAWEMLKNMIIDAKESE